MKKRIQIILVLCILPILAAGCKPRTEVVYVEVTKECEPQSSDAEMPDEAAMEEEQGNTHLLVISEDLVTIHAVEDGAWADEEIEIDELSDLRTHGDWIVVSDASGDRIFDFNGRQPEWIVDPVPKIYTVADRIIIASDGEVRFYQEDDLDNYVKEISTEGLAEIQVVDQRIVLIDDQYVRTLNLDGEDIGSDRPIPRSYQERVHAVGELIILIGENRAWISRYDEYPDGHEIIADEGAKLEVVEEWVVVVDEDHWVRVYDLTGDELHWLRMQAAEEAEFRFIP